MYGRDDVMADITDQRYLREKQYHDASNLTARGDLHARFSSNPEPWFRWYWNGISAEPASRFLELGCGPAWLWVTNGERIPPSWRITLSDLSPGMLDEARRNLRDVDHMFQFEEVDAQNIPFEDGAFDVVIANHMLYHVPDRGRALHEIRRVIRPGGTLYAATNGQSHMQELRALVQRAAPELELWHGPRPEKLFPLDRGAEEVGTIFENVEIRRRPSHLWDTEAEPVVAYILSLARESAKPDDTVRRLHQYIGELLAHDGGLRITQDSGVIVAR